MSMKQNVKWYSLPQRIDTPLGKGVIRKRRLNPIYRTDIHTKYEGIVQSVTHSHKVVTDYDNDLGHIDQRDNDYNLVTRQSTCINARTKQVSNKKPQGENRRKQAQRITDSINVKTRAYYRARYGN